MNHYKYVYYLRNQEEKITNVLKRLGGQEITHQFNLVFSEVIFQLKLLLIMI